MHKQELLSIIFTQESNPLKTIFLAWFFIGLVQLTNVDFLACSPRCVNRRIPVSAGEWLIRDAYPGELSTSSSPLRCSAIPQQVIAWF